MQKNLYKLQAYGFFHSLIFAYIIERLFGLERGLSIQDMVWVEISYAALTVLLEVPTGALADRWSRKKVMVLSAIFCFFEFYLLIFAYSLWGFLLSALAAAIGNCLASGTDNALLYDSLKAQGQADKFEKYFGRIRFWGSLAGLAAALLGSQIAVRLNLTANYWFSLIGVGACILISLSLKEPPIRSRDESPESEARDGGYWQHIFTALRFVRDHASLGTVVVYAAVLAAGFVYLDEYSQIYLKQVGIPITLFGIWSGLYMLLEIGCVASAWRLKDLFKNLFRGRFGTRVLFTLLLLGSGTAMLVAGEVHSPWGLIPVLLAFCAIWLSQPLTTGYLHHHTESHHRATVESCANLLSNGGSVLLGLVFGWVATHFSIFRGYQLLGGVLLIYGLYWIFSSRKLENR